MAFVPKAWRDIPDRSTPINAAALIDMETRLGAYADTGDTAARAYADAGDVSVVAHADTGDTSARAYTDSEITRWASKTLLTPAQFLALPAQPDGTVVRVLANATDGVVWTLRFNAGSSNAAKWECVGGRPLRSQVMPNVALAVTSTPTASGGPSISTPLAGDYDLQFGATINPPASTVGVIYAMVNGAIQGSAQANSGTGGSNPFSQLLGLPIAAAIPIDIRYASSPNGTVNYAQRTLTVMPVRVQGP
jgi:hypothetical protein